MADFREKFIELTNTPDTTTEYSQQDILNNTVMAILSYLGWLVLIPLFAAKESPYARFHCNQGIVLAIAEIAVVVVFGVLSKLPILGWIFSILKLLIGIVCAVLAILGIINAANKKAKSLPIIGGIQILK